MRKRLIRISITIEGQTFKLTEELGLRVKVNKAALSIQNRATVEVTGLTTEMREGLLSQFTAWNKRLVDSAQIQGKYARITIEAGYASQGKEDLSIIFLGDVVLVDPVSGPPDIGVRITAFSRQIDKTRWISNVAPAKMTFYNLVAWAAEQMGFGTNFVCETSYNDKEIENPARSMHIVGSLVIYIQDLYKPDVAAFIDDDVLIVKDRNKIVSRASLVPVNKLVGTPSWNEWGMEFVTMFDPAIRLAGGIALTSKMNPGINGNYVLTSLEYDLTSRERAFYVKGAGSPPAAS